MLDIETIYIKHLLEELYRNDLISFDEWMATVNAFNKNNCSTKPTIDLLKKVCNCNMLLTKKEV